MNKFWYIVSNTYVNGRMTPIPLDHVFVTSQEKFPLSEANNALDAVCKKEVFENPEHDTAHHIIINQVEISEEEYQDFIVSRLQN